MEVNENDYSSHNTRIFQMEVFVCMHTQKQREVRQLAAATRRSTTSAGSSEQLVHKNNTDWQKVNDRETIKIKRK